MFAFGDTPFDPEFTVYSRVSAIELLPDPIPPLGWSVVGPALEEGFRISFCDDFGLLPRPEPEIRFLMVGRMAARLHLNLSLIRTTAHRLPGTSAEVADLEYFGDPTAFGLPDVESRGDDRRFRIRAPSNLGRTLAGIGRRVNRDRAAVDEMTVAVTALLDGEPTEAELVRAAQRCGSLLGRVHGTHVTTRGLTAPVLEQARAALHRADIGDVDATRLLARIPDLESARPARALAEVAASVGPGSPLDALVQQRSWLDLSQSTDPAAAELAGAVGAFLTEFGHRGSCELDPTRDTWGRSPDDVVALVAAMPRDSVSVHGADSEDLDHLDPGRLGRPLVAAARNAVARVERTRDTSARATHLVRLLLDRVRTSMADRVADGDFWMCTLPELEAVAHGGSVPAPAELWRRAEDHAQAVAFEPASWSDGVLRPDSGETGPEGDVAGVGGSPGVAEGVVRVMTGPTDRFEPGEVIVTRVADVGWSPLMTVAAAVVSDIGGPMSEGAVVARDLGMPAVVGTRTSTRRLRSGDRVSVDGNSGTVSALA